MSSMRILAALSVALLVSCAPRPAPPPPAPTAPPSQPTPPPSPPNPLPWQEAPLEPGDWSYSQMGGASHATFGGEAHVFTVECNVDRRITLSRAGVRGGNVLTVATTEGVRSVAATLEAGSLVARLDPDDPLLDAMAFSRGRFAVEASGGAGVAGLVLPAWPELARVVEDCRR